MTPRGMWTKVPLTWRGELSEADRLAAEAMDAAYVSRNDLFMSSALTMRCAVQTRMGELEEAVRLGEEAVQLVREGGARIISGALAGCYLAEPYLELGEPGR